MKSLVAVILSVVLLYPATARASNGDDANTPVMTDNFLYYHPDIRYRRSGLDAYKRGDFERALSLFKRAGYYGDKPSQGMVAEMLWNGVGAKLDRAAAYVWMDLAAERGYKGFTGLREQYWEALAEDDRKRAQSLAGALWEEYRDSAAQLRQKKRLKLGQQEITGSRTGFVGNVQVIVPAPGMSNLFSGSRMYDGSKFYDQRFWNAEKYWASVDQIWNETFGGEVEVGDVEQVEQRPVRPTP